MEKHWDSLRATVDALIAGTTEQQLEANTNGTRAEKLAAMANRLKAEELWLAYFTDKTS